mmetsp:Transcript_11210/g.41857  ORF Transcript_11210/g.41857 Transcript_11210/m.41857 type:complete len:143 (-) Transcript_11210:176-604(-)
MGNHEATLLLEQSEPLRKPRQFGPRSPPRPQVPSTAKKSKRKKKKKSSTESEDSPVSSSEDAEPSPRNLISKELEDELEKYENLVQDLKAQAGGASTEDLAEDVDLIMLQLETRRKKNEATQRRVDAMKLLLVDLRLLDTKL